MNDTPQDDLTFEQALAALEKMVRELEDGQTGLEESLACYEKGVGLLKRCYGQLSQAEQRISVVIGSDDNGKPLTKPFKHVATAGKEAERERDAASPPAPTPPPRRKKPDEVESSLF